MITIHLSGEDADVLQAVLESDVSDLGMEIAGTDRLDFRRALRVRKQTLIRVMESLESEHR